MMRPIDILNWVGTRPRLRLPGRVVLAGALSLGLPRLLRLAGRRVVSASAGAPAMLLTAGDIERALKDRDLMYRALEFTVAEMHLDTLCTVADLSLEAEACGCRVQFHQRDMPSVVTHPVHSKADMAGLAVPDPEHDGRMPVNLDTLERLKRRYSMITAATVTGPFTLALQMCGSAIYLDALKDPEKVDAVIEYSRRVATRYAEALIAHGADMIIIMEPALSQLSPRLYERFARHSIDGMAGGLTRPTMLHVCGKAGHLVSSMAKSRCAAFSVDDVDMALLGGSLPRNSVAVGNLSPLLLQHGPAPAIEKQTLELLDKTAAKREVIIAPGCDLAPNTPLANILAFVNTVKTWRPPA